MRIRVATLMLVALIMWRIKRYYADANVDDLQWILGPTARLVTAVTTTPFQWEAGEGYLSRERMFLIEKACAGINFMIAAFGMVAFVLRRRMCSVGTSAAVVIVSLTTSYAAAIGVNAVRITAALWLAAHSVHLPGMDAVQFHRFEGIVFYFGGLVLLHAIVQRFDDQSRSMRLTTPLLAYYTLTLAVPLANGAWRNAAAFVEYAIFVLTLPLAFVALVAVIGSAFAAPPDRTPDRSRATSSP